ncbi:MAG: PIG-L family deacetylase [Blastocatellia bacterium]|nr:PIG-L family deacetylase [Blastocatellia bacterium]
MKRKIGCVLLTLCIVLPSLSSSLQAAQVQDIPYNQGAAAAWQALIKLRTTATVLFTQAHPDDEDAGLVTWVARRAGARTGILSINRGEGGANLIGPEQYDALGILRTEEFLAACRYYGADLMFTRMADFGFSKRLDETLEHWGKENVLRDMVRAVRTYKPDIIISRFHGKARDGHGNHQAAGLLSFEAFKAAADPKMFPEDGSPWQVKKMYLITRGNEPSTLKINTGEYDPLLGKSYRQIGSEGYGMHRSQAMGQPRIPAGDFFSTVQLVESAIPKAENEQSIFDGLDTTLTGLAKQYQNVIDLRPELNESANAIEKAISKFNAREPWTIAEELASVKRDIYKAIEKVKASNIAVKDHLLFLLGNKERECDEAMNKALGLSLEALVDPDRPATSPMGFMQPRETFAVGIPHQSFSVTARLTNRTELSIKIAGSGFVHKFKGKVQPIEVSQESVVGKNQSYIHRIKFELAAQGEYDKPFWSRNSEIRDHLYQHKFLYSIVTPFDPPQFTAITDYIINNVNFKLDAPVQTSFIARPFGEQRRLLTIAPAINIQMTPRVGIVALNAAKSEATVNVSVSSNAKSKADGKVKLRVPAGWNVTPAEQPFSFAREGEKSNFTFTVAIPKLAANQDYKIQAVAEYNGKEYTEGYEVIAHRDLEPRHLYRNATMDIRGVDVAVAPNLHVGYVMGVGDKVPEALTQIGVKVTMLGANELATGNLDQFDAVVIGIRASAVRDDLKAYNKRLLEYVERGGNVIWQYQTPEFDEAAYGPYPYKMGRNPEEVSEEDARVTILDATNPIFTFPNKITPADFDNWVEERGSKWWGEWDARYKSLLEAHDREQPLQKGGMMYAEYGKGTWVYAGYAFYRQLPAGVQGAYRLFANLISLKKRTR